MTDFIPVLGRETKEPTPFEPLVVGLVSEWPGVGASSFARFADTVPLSRDLHNYVRGLAPSEHDESLEQLGDTHTIRMRGLLNNAAQRLGLAEGLDTENMLAMRNLHREIRARGDQDKVINGLEGMGNRFVIIDAIRHPADAEHIKTRGGYIVALTAPEAIADERFLSDNNDHKHLNGPNSPDRQEALAVAKQERQPEDPTDLFSSDIVGTVLLADVRIDFSGDVDRSYALGIAALRNIGLHKLGIEPLVSRWPQIHAEIPA